MTRSHKPMTPREIAELRGQVVLDSQRIGEIADRQRALRAELADLTGEGRHVTSRRDAGLVKLRRAGVDVADLAADSGLTPGRIRQIAPGAPAAPRGRRPGPAPARGRRTEVTVSVDQLVDDEPAEAPRLSGIAAAVAALPQPAPRAAVPAWIGPGQPHTPAAPADRPKVKRAPAVRGAGAKARLPKVRGRYTVDERVEEALQAAAGDIEAAAELLKNSAVDDAMALLDACRAGAVYDYTAHPSLPEPLIRAGRKKADQVWEGRPKWRNPHTPEGTRVDVLDVNAAYLAALRKTHLPIGKLVRDTDPAAYNPRRAGIYLVDPPAWVPTDVPNPIGEGRTEAGPVWITTPTLRLLQRAYGPDIPIPILDSWTSGASESLLTKFGDTLNSHRMQALQDGDTVTLGYVKELYSRFVSTSGDSAANHDIRRPEWTHAMRSQAFANLWLKGARAAACGLHVHAIVGTDELHVAGDWRAAMWKDRPAFPEGRALPQIKHKRSYVVGGDQDHDQEVNGD